MTEWKKNAFAVAVPIETLLMFATGDWRRKIDYTEEIPVPEQEWDEYHEAVALLERLREFDNFNEGCSCEHAYIEEPRPRTIFHYAETKEEWEARVWAKLDAGEQPDNQALKFNQDVVDFFFGASPLMEMQSQINDTHANLRSIGRAVDYSFQQLPQAGWTTEDQRASRGGTFAPNARVVADHIRSQIKLDVFDKECND